MFMQWIFRFQEDIHLNTKNVSLLRKKGKIKWNAEKEVYAKNKKEVYIISSSFPLET